MLLRLVLVGSALLLSAGAASAEPISLDAYRRALGEVRAQVDLARGLAGPARRAALTRALATLEGAREVRVDSAIYTDPPHRALRVLIMRGDDVSLTRASGMLEETLAAIAAAAREGGPDPQQARRQLEAILAAPDFRRQPDWRDAVAALLRDWLAALFPELRAPRVSIEQAAVVLGAVAAGLLIIVGSSTFAGARASVTREHVLPAERRATRATASDHLAAAESATRAGRLREALRELFLFALLGLEERGALRLDPALTDREILLRAAGLPRAEELASLVAAYERAWYGLREPTPQEVARAREFARRVAA